MKIKESVVQVDDTCRLEISVTRILNDGITAGDPLVLIEKVVQGINDDDDDDDDEPTRLPMFLTPKKAIKLAELLRNCGKEAYAQRIEED